MNHWLHSWICRIEAIRDGIAFAKMVERKSSIPWIEAKFSAPTLAERNIGIGDEFLCVLKIDHRVLIRKLKPKPVSKERVAEIRKEFEGRWDF